MDLGQNNSPEGAQYAPPQFQPENIYMPKPKARLWLWITLSAVFVVAMVAAVLIALGGANEGRSIKGNAGVAALYEFCNEQQRRQDALTGSIAKEIGHRLLEEPFEIDARLEMGLEDMGLSYLPVNSIMVGMEAKYDMKDLGIKANVLGMEMFGAYIIEDNIVVSVMGKAGSMPVPAGDKDALGREMGLAKRVNALLPFLPEDEEVFFELLEAFALSVPDSCTQTGTEDIYSPKEDKDVEADVVTTVIDSKAIIKTAKNFEDELDANRELSRKIERIIDGFTEFAGLEPVDMEDGIKGLIKAAESGELEDINISWSVYSRNGSYIGVSFEIFNKDNDVSYTLMSEFGERESFQCVNVQSAGTETQTITHTIWEGNKTETSGEVTVKVSEGTGNTTQIYDGTIEFRKESASEYVIAGDFVFKGDAYNDILNSEQSMSFDMEIEAEIKAGAGLGTLREDRDWDSIYNKEWGSIEDLFGQLIPSGILPYVDDGNNL